MIINPTNYIPPTESQKVEIRASFILEQREHFRREMAKHHANQEAYKSMADELQKHWAEEFNAASEKIAKDHGISVKTAELILASITAGEVPNFRATFYDDL